MYTLFDISKIKVAHPTVRQNLLGLIYMGFLVPVLGPALTQVSKIYFLDPMQEKYFKVFDNW